MASTERQSANMRKKLSATMRERYRNRMLLRIFIGIIAVLVAFLLGFWMRSNTSFVSSLGIPVEEQSPQSVSTTNKTTYDTISERVGEVEDILESSSMDEADLPEATRTMLADLLKSTNDPYAQYFDSARYENYVKESADRQYGGIGVIFGEYDGRAYASDVFNGSQADALGIQTGDRVISIDGDSSHPWTMTEVIGALDKEVGNNVVITWMRPSTADASTGQEFTTTLECNRQTVDNITYRLEGDVGYIKIRQNTSDAAAVLSNAINELQASGARAFVIDVRDNAGGYLTQALDMASLFIASGVLVSIETNDGTSARNASGTPQTTLPVVILINEYTAASAEVFTAALQDNRRATTVGHTTMGKGSVQVLRELTFGGAVRYTAAYYLTPLGHNIDGAGIVPDIAVANDPEDESDTQYLVAIDCARSLAAGA